MWLGANTVYAYSWFSEDARFSVVLDPRTGGVYATRYTIQRYQGEGEYIIAGIWATTEDLLKRVRRDPETTLFFRKKLNINKDNTSRYVHHVIYQPKGSNRV